MKKPKYGCFVDFAKAFDSVNRTILINKLTKVGISAAYQNTLLNLLGKNLVQICIDDFVTPEIEQERGLLQGDPISPLLFNIFIADLPNHLEKYKAETFFYADDLVILGDNPRVMQDTLDLLETWCRTHTIEVNVTKTKVVKFRSRGQPVKDYFRLKYKKCDLEYVNIFKHLGIQLSYFLSDIPHFEYCKQKAINAIGALQTRDDFKKISLDTAT